MEARLAVEELEKFKNRLIGFRETLDNEVKSVGKQLNDMDSWNDSKAQEFRECSAELTKIFKECDKRTEEQIQTLDRIIDALIKYLNS
ncbi:hypothetical protein [Helicobacter cetorum]|uniref:hypothetical protein n=1 Tax=Helicobacter cetorum TaxID=138563 RepID=UPI000CF06094|nr:hypothetical protein [Helicobacter cetorum]